MDVKRQFIKFLNEYGPEKYEQIWGYPFPEQELARLDSAAKAVSASN